MVLAMNLQVNKKQHRKCVASYSLAAVCVGFRRSLGLEVTADDEVTTPGVGQLPRGNERDDHQRVA